MLVSLLSFFFLWEVIILFVHIHLYFNLVCTLLLPQTTIDPFMIIAVLHSSGTFVSGKMMILRENRDVINPFNCSTTSFYGEGYYYHSQMSWMNAGVIVKGSISPKSCLSQDCICLKWKVFIPLKTKWISFYFLLESWL
jgi:hypothetical protein